MKNIYARVMLVTVALILACMPVFAVNVSSRTGSDGGTPDNKTVSQAMAEFKSLSKKEKHSRMKQVKQAIREYKAQKKSAEPSTNTLLLVILAILLPPLAVYLHEGAINSKFWIDLLLTLLIWLPGVIYALIVILS